MADLGAQFMPTTQIQTNTIKGPTTDPSQQPPGTRPATHPPQPVATMPEVLNLISGEAMSEFIAELVGPELEEMAAELEELLSEREETIDEDGPFSRSNMGGALHKSGKRDGRGDSRGREQTEKEIKKIKEGHHKSKRGRTIQRARATYYKAIQQLLPSFMKSLAGNSYSNAEKFVALSNIGHIAEKQKTEIASSDLSIGGIGDLESTRPDEDDHEVSNLEEHGNTNIDIGSNETSRLDEESYTDKPYQVTQIDMSLAVRTAAMNGLGTTSMTTQKLLSNVIGNALHDAVRSLSDALPEHRDGIPDLTKEDEVKEYELIIQRLKDGDQTVTEEIVAHILQSPKIQQQVTQKISEQFTAALSEGANSSQA